MPFDPSPPLELNIEDVVYRFSEHPNALGLAYGQEGRRAIVYQLATENGSLFALKVFKPRFRVPRMVVVAEKLASYSALPGLQACQRIVLTGSRHPDLLAVYPDLTYAVLMPWVEGSTWQEILLSKMVFDPDRSLNAARSLAQVLMTMEERGLAHCDLSGPNLILSPENVAILVDLEEMYGPDFIRPKELPSGSSGYAHKTAPLCLWQEEADRFAGALLLGEMLGWCDEHVRHAAWGESYFSSAEMQLDSSRSKILINTLEEHWGKRIIELFNQAWHSESLLDCPNFAEWNIALRQVVSQPTIVNGHTVAIDKYGNVSQTGETFRMVPTEEASLEAWTCPHCGKEVQESQEVCPYCERSREAVNGPKSVALRRIPFWGWIIGGVALLFLVFGGNKIILPIIKPKLTPTMGTTQLPTVIPTLTREQPLKQTIALTLSPSLSPTLDPSKTLTPTQISSNTPTPLPIAVVSAENANIRSGPGIVYPVVLMVTKGVNLPIVGRTQDSTWLVVTMVDGTDGWMAVSLIETNTLIESLPIIDTPPTPIPSLTATPIPEAKKIYPMGDANRDCIVDSHDYDIWLAAYQTKRGDPGYDPRADFNGDGYIDGIDYTIWLNHFGDKCN